MQPDVVQVQIVSHWWADPLPIVAILLSVGTLIWTIWDKRRDSASVKVRAIPTTFLDPFNMWFVSIEARNAGRTHSTVVNSITLELPTGETMHQLENPAPDAVTLPKRIEPGESFRFLFGVRQIAIAMNDRHADPAKIRAVVETGHGRKKGRLSSQAVQMVGKEMHELRRRAECLANQEKEQAPR